MARGVRPGTGGAPCAPSPAKTDPPPALVRHPQAYGIQCRDCAPIGCDGSCDLPPFTD
ncbi:hypothetical protein [Isoptericola sp. NPDC055881]